MHSETSSIEDFVLQEERARVRALEELARLDRRLDRVVKRMVHGRRELRVLILEHHAEGLGQEILCRRLRGGLAALHQVFQVGQIVQPSIVGDSGWLWPGWLGSGCRAAVGNHLIRAACADIVDLPLQEV